jgi:hypothetical protein
LVINFDVIIFFELLKIPFLDCQLLNFELKTMDLETENRLASLLIEEARRLQLEADREGVHAYLRKPNVRHRPNSRFLTATVRGVQQG